MDELSRNKRILKKVITHMSVMVGVFIITILLGQILSISTMNTWLGAIGSSIFFIVFFKMLLDIARIITSDNKKKSNKEKHLNFIPFSAEMCVAYFLYFFVFCGILGGILAIIFGLTATTGEFSWGFDGFWNN